MPDQTRTRTRKSRRAVRPRREATKADDTKLYEDEDVMEEAAVNFARYVGILRRWAEAERMDEGSGE